MNSDPDRLLKAQENLTARLKPFMGREITERACKEMDEIVREHRRQCRLRGLDFPELALIPLRLVGSVELVHRELDCAGIETVIVNLTRKWPGVTAKELAFGITYAFPEYRGQVIAQAERNLPWAETQASALH